MRKKEREFVDYLVKLATGGKVPFFHEVLKEFSSALKELGYKVKIDYMGGGLARLVITKKFMTATPISWTWNNITKVTVYANGWFGNEQITTDDRKELEEKLVDWMGRGLLLI